MSLLSGIGKFFKKLLDAILKILKWLLPILIIILIIIAIFFPYLLPIIMQWAAAAWTAVAGWVSTAWGWISSGVSFIWKAVTEYVAEASFADVLKLAAGAAVILNPEGVADAAGGLLEDVADIATKVLGPVLPWILGGLAVYFLWPSSKDSEVVLINRDERKGDEIA